MIPMELVYIHPVFFAFSHNIFGHPGSMTRFALEGPHVLNCFILRSG